MSLNRVTKAALAASAVCTLGVIGTGCLSRPVTHQEPTLKTNFTAQVKQQAVDKVDLLFMVDNSASMGDKQALLAQAVPDLVNRLITPNCLDASGAVVGVSMNNGACPAGQKAEFPAVHDMHIGVVSSSLGSAGADRCSATEANPTNMALNRHNDDAGHLLNRGGVSEAAVGDEGTSNFLAWFPMVDQNTGKPAPPGGVASLGDAGKFSTDFTNLVSGVHEYGCGFEAQLESWYRFLIQPDPYDHINLVGGQRAEFVGIDATVLQQRHDFLRPDSLFAVIVVTDESEDTVDPLALGGQGWAYLNTLFPGNPGTGTAPKGTPACAMNPNDPACDSCYFHQPGGPAPDPACASPFYDPADDNANIRAFHMKQRFGLDPQYPLSRYTRGLTKATVPDRDHQHFGGSPAYTGEGVDDQGKPNANCTNPLYAINLPVDATGELCHLKPGPRTSDYVFYALIGGVPHQLLQQDPTDPNSPQKDALTEADWTKILGKDPFNYDFSGADPHMLESATPRPGIAGPGMPDTADPINGRDWDTKKQDLEYACVFNFTAPKDCSLPQFKNACDCDTTPGAYSGPLCQAAGSSIQTRGKAYPTIRELGVAHALGTQAIVSSICPIHVQELTPGDPLFGYRPAVKAIIDRLKNALANQCLPNPLTPHADGSVDCLILETLASNDQSLCTKTPGLQPAPADVLSKFRESQNAADPTGATAKLATCAVKQLLTPDLVQGSCSASGAPGWCYVTGAAAGTCPQAILFSPTGNPQVGATISLQCIETSSGGPAAVGASDAGTGGGG